MTTQDSASYENDSVDVAPDNGRKKRVQRPYPACPFSDALEIGQGIATFASGQRVRRLTLMENMGLNENSSGTRQKITDSSKYGITKGSYTAEHLELTPDGKIVFDESVSEPERLKAMFGLAIQGVKPFAILYEQFKDKRVPTSQVMLDVLTESGIEVPNGDECVRTFLDNAKYLGLVRSFGGSASPALISIQGAIEQLTSDVQIKPTSNRESLDAPAITLATPAAGPSTKVCFVIMPFSERDDEHLDGFFSEVLRSLFTPAVTSAGFAIRTAHRKGSDVIQATIVKELLQADLVLADLTEHNPNVLFELGMRMHADKPVVLVKAKGTGRIFDVDNMLRVEEYDARLWPTTIEADIPRLTDHIRGAWNNRESEDTFLKILQRHPGSIQPSTLSTR